MPLVLVQVKSSLGISDAQAGAISATSGVLFIVGSFFWGILAEKIGLRKSLTLACLMLSIGTVFMGTIDSVATGMLSYSLIGFAAGAPTTLSIILAGAWFDRRKRGIALSYCNSPRTLWTALLGLTVPIIMLAYGWRNVWYILGAISLFLSIIVFVLVRNNPQEKGLSPCGSSLNEHCTAANQLTTPKEQVRWRDVIKMRITWHLGAIFILNVFVLVVFTFFIIAFLITEVKLTPAAAGGAFSIFSVAMVAGSYVWGFISDYVNRKYVVAVASILYAVLLITFVGYGKEMAIICFLFGGMGFAAGTPPVTFAMIPDHFPIQVRGVASGLINSISGVGFVLGPLVAGSIASATGSFIPAFQIAAAVAVALAIIVLALREPIK